MSNRANWPCVYPGINGKNTGDVHRVQARVPDSDARLLISVVADPEILSHVIQLEIKFLANEIRTNDLTYADSARFIDYLRKRSAAQLTYAEAASADDTGRSPGGNKSASHAKNKRTVVGKGAA